MKASDVGEWESKSPCLAACDTPLLTVAVTKTTLKESIRRRLIEGFRQVLLARNRYILPILLNKIKFSPVVAIQGARQVGKSYLVRELLPENKESSVYLTMDKIADRSLATEAPESFLEKHRGSQPIIIDEAQKAPVLFDVIKYEVDLHRTPGQFILLGSTEFSKKTLIRESLTGRMSSLRLFPLTMGEALSLPRKKTSTSFSPAKIPRCSRHDLMRHLERGGMPGIFSVHSERERQILVKDWIDLTVYRDLNLIPRVKLDSDLVMLILKQVAVLEEPTAGNIAKKLGKDVRRIQTHLDCLELLFALHRLNPIEESSGKPYYFFCDVAFACFFEASFERCLYTWLVQEVLASKEWTDNIRETIGYYRSLKGSITHLVIKRSANDWQCVKLIAKEMFSEKDVLSLTALREKIPQTISLELTALTATSGKLKGVNCIPWESIC